MQNERDKLGEIREAEEKTKVVEKKVLMGWGNPSPSKNGQLQAEEEEKRRLITGRFALLKRVARGKNDQ